MTISRQELINFLTYTQNNTIKPDSYTSVGVYPHIWTDDDWHMEVAKYLLIGETNYLSYNPPSRLKGNPYYNPQKLVDSGKIKIKTADALSKISAEEKTLLICEVGRGLDILVSASVKKWDRVICYDYVNYKLHLSSMFPGSIIDFFTARSEEFNEDSIVIDRPTIAIANDIRCKDKELLRSKLVASSNLVRVIWEGELIK